MANGPHEAKEPLRSEEMEREKWREGETLIDEAEEPGHSLPASEQDEARSRERIGPTTGPGTIAPPD